MISGLFLRHYKIYQGLYFIPLASDYENRYSIIVGNNGVGKSSILEALNTFFNNGNWNKNKDGKRDEAFIAPLFLIKKNELKKELQIDAITEGFIDYISNYFWQSSQDINRNLGSEEFKKFFSFRDELKSNYDPQEYYLFLVGIYYDNKNEVNFITFNDHLLKNTPQTLHGYEKDKVLDIIRQYYSYLYIPVEATTSDILKLENREMQELMNKDILNQIDSLLNDKLFENGKKKISVLDYLNTSLNSYVDSINDIIKNIDDKYAFKVEGVYKKNLTSADVRKKILEAYFSIRTLKKERKEVHELSSGEQRIALIDIATAFLTESKGDRKNIVLAIDEPENSLHISRSFNQFERLQKLSTENQVLLTTHWYGSLPISDKGDLHHLDVIDNKTIKSKSYKLSNYFEKRGQLPDDIIIKSYFELTSSILSSMRSDNANWIICEGSDDKVYLERYINDVPNLKILTVGGCGNVVKLYKYLYIPFLEKEEDKSIKGKVLCLVDTDENINTIDIKSESNSKKLKICRMQINTKNEVELVGLAAGGLHKPTEIEDCLDPNTFFNALEYSIMTHGNMEQRDAIGAFSFNSEMGFSFVRGESSILKPNSIEALDQKKHIYSFIDNYRNKYMIADAYINLERGSNLARPKLFELISDYFTT